MSGLVGSSDLISLIVSDAGPLIALSRIGRLSLLPDLFATVAVPRIVVQELRLDEPRAGVAPLAAAAREQTWLRSMDSPDESSIPGLDAGESAAIRLAGRLECTLLIDERRGRGIARRRGVPVIGIGRVLVAAKERGRIESVAAALTGLRESGYRLSDRICAQLLTIADERQP